MVFGRRMGSSTHTWCYSPWWRIYEKRIYKNRWNNPPPSVMVSGSRREDVDWVEPAKKQVSPHNVYVHCAIEEILHHRNNLIHWIMQSRVYPSVQVSSVMGFWYWWITWSDIQSPKKAGESDVVLWEWGFRICGAFFLSLSVKCKSSTFFTWMST